MPKPGTHTSSPPAQDAQELREVTPAENGCESDQAEVEDPDVVLPPGLREFRLSQEDAQRLEQLLDDPEQPTHDGKEMPTADALDTYRIRTNSRATHAITSSAGYSVPSCGSYTRPPLSQQRTPAATTAVSHSR
jgi:hypothetical protein